MWMGYNLVMTIQELSKLEKQKELIGFYKTMWTVVVTVLVALLGWFALYDRSDALAGLALASIVSLLILLVWMHFKVLTLIDQLGEMRWN
jgi:glucan phosphoethanolaminetransferase (alkaline phosphatase superfamily)